MKSIQTDAVITGVRARVDGSLGLSVTTPELTPQEKVLFIELQNMNVSLTITPKEETNAPEYKVNKDLETKTPSVRLRNVLYLLHQQKGIDEDFDTYYKRQLEKFIQAVKDQLEGGENY